MNKQDQNQLLCLLKSFFEDYDLNARDFLNKNQIASFLKKEMLKKDRWKNLTRGKPNKFRI
jgi:hypothetical protein